MPNIGKPSTGCFACRRMKVRCDEQKPACARCTRANRSCPGYGDMFLLVDPTKKTRRSSAKAKRIKAMTAITKTTEAPLPIIQGLFASEQDWYDRSMKLFFHTHTHHLVENDGRPQRLLDTLEGYCSGYVLEPYLADALKAASLSNMAHRAPEVPWLASRAVQHRCEALEGIRTVLSDEDKARKDDLLAALWCIQKAEVTESEITQHQNHSAGISAILKLRGEPKKSSAIAHQLYNHLNCQLAVGDSLYGSDYHHVSEDPALRPPVMISEVARFVKDYRDLLTGKVVFTRDDIYEEALRLDAQVEAKSHGLTPAVREHSKTIGSSTITVKEFNHNIDAIPWFSYHTIRLRSLRIAAECAPDSDALKDTIVAQVLGIASLIPALLSEYSKDAPYPEMAEASSNAASIAMGACNAVVNTPEFTDQDIRDWIYNNYTYIGQAFGLKQAFAFRDYFSSGTALADSERLKAMSSGRFPDLAPAMFRDHEPVLRQSSEIIHDFI